MSAVRTTWRAKPCGWRDRERVVALGEEHGPAGPLVLDVLEELAKEQRDGDHVRTGLRSLARAAFLPRGTEGVEAARAILRTAAEVGALDELAVGEDADMVVTCRVSGFSADQGKGYEAVRKGQQRADTDTPPDGPTDRDHSGLRPDDRDSVPGTAPGVPVGPPTGQDRTEDPPTPLPGGDADDERSTTATRPPPWKRKPVSPERARLAWQLVAEVNRVGQVDHEPLKADGSWSESASRVLGALDGYPAITLDLGRRMIELAAQRRWWQGPMHAKHVFAPGVVETLLQEARRPQLVPTGTTATGEPDRLPGETDTQRSARLKAAGRERAARRAADHDAAQETRP